MVSTMKTTTTYYKNKRNNNKIIEVHNDQDGHYGVRQLMIFNSRMSRGFNFIGDGVLHRWRKKNLTELLDDYVLVTDNSLKKHGLL